MIGRRDVSLSVTEAVHPNHDNNLLATTTSSTVAKRDSTIRPANACSMMKQEDEEIGAMGMMANSKNGNIECPICLDSYQVGDFVSWSVRKGACSHIFHKNCIQSWLVDNDDCPMCRQIVLIDETDMKDVA